MKRSQVILLLDKLQKEYKNQIDTSEEEELRLYEALKDFPFDKAVENVKQHIATIPWPPKIAQIRGGQGDVREHEREKIDTAHLLALRENSRAEIVPPPAGMKEALYAKWGISRTAEQSGC